MKRLILLVLALALLLGPTLAHAQEPPTPDPKVEELLRAMSPEQRVGQLFLITFPGEEVPPDSAVASLVRDLHIGGVMLRASNGNVRNVEGLPSRLVALTNQLQALAFAGSGAVEAQGSGPFIPLFIAADIYSPTATYSDGLPQAGFSSLPSEMAIGATWQPANARLIGETVGQEMAAVGINLLLGPALDVVDTPRPEQKTNIGTRTFGGDPYWVGVMGRAFVQGVADGSGGSIATIARHFPGLGSSDRRPDQEIATVQKSLPALQRQDLPPFFAVTNMGKGGVTVDGLMSTNLRYRGLQGNIGQYSRPISLDPQSLPALLNLPELQPWRQAGGILVSDELGAPALRRFYAQQTPDNPTFPHRQVAQDALTAGNDLLFLADFALEDSWQAREANIRETVQYFTELYQNDPAFAARVDESVRRLLALKLRLYGGDLAKGLIPLPDPTTVEASPLRQPEQQNELDRISREAVTLLYPGTAEVADRLPRPPLGNERIVIFTDARTTQDCATCEPIPLIPVDVLESALLRRFGPSGSGQLIPANITSLTFEALSSYLDNPDSVTGRGVADELAQADWLIFLTQDVSAQVPASDALRRFLAASVGQVRDQKLLVYSFGPPYYLDATEVSKVTAYYAFYTPTLRAVDAAAQLLFQSFPAAGSSPVSVLPLNDDLRARLEPAADQVVDICSDLPESPPESCEPLSLEEVTLGSELALRTSVIRDRNGHTVPDGTIVTFLLLYPNENVERPRQSVPTVDGIARAVITLEREGQLAISVASDPPTFTSTTVLVTIQGSEPPVVETVVPEPEPTETATPSPTATVTPRPILRPRPTATATPAGPLGGNWNRSSEGFGWWVLAGTLVGLGAIGGLGFTSMNGGRSQQMQTLLRAFQFGLGTYILYLLAYGFNLLPAGFSGWGAIALALLAGLVALVLPRPSR